MVFSQLRIIFNISTITQQTRLFGSFSMEKSIFIPWKHQLQQNYRNQLYFNT